MLRASWGVHEGPFVSRRKVKQKTSSHPLEFREFGCQTTFELSGLFDANLSKLERLIQVSCVRIHQPSPWRLQVKQCLGSQIDHNHRGVCGQGRRVFLCFRGSGPSRSAQGGVHVSETRPLSLVLCSGICAVFFEYEATFAKPSTTQSQWWHSGDYDREKLAAHLQRSA